MEGTHSNSQILIVSVLLAAFMFGGCTVGPKYQRPSAQAPATYKELTPADFSKTDGWKVAQPQDNVLHGKWWTMFNDPQLNALEEQVNISRTFNQPWPATWLRVRWSRKPGPNISRRSPSARRSLGHVRALQPR
jgi:hypothetical protein